MTKMPHPDMIKCLGCNAVINVTSQTCPGCGRCPGCGNRRTKEIQNCPSCAVPYCECCGRCNACQSLRYSDLTDDCQCGHPYDAERLEELRSMGRIKPESERRWWDH